MKTRHCTAAESSESRQEEGAFPVSCCEQRNHSLQNSPIYFFFQQTSSCMPPHKLNYIHR
eukprot:scaffold1124_cov270-Chaetoceros_neogracile.AAC.35